MDEEIRNRARDLIFKSQSRDVYTYTDFLSLAEQEEVLYEAGRFPVKFYGGGEETERKIACFGDENLLCYPPEFPVKILFIKPLNEKFAKPFTHRDVLGATLALGVERSKVGDIFIVDKTAYMAVYSTISEHLKRELKKVASVTVEAIEVENLPDCVAAEKKEKTVSVASERADAVISSVYNLSRESSSALFAQGKVFVNGKEFPDGSKKLKPGDLVTARGYGRFTFFEECGQSRKGKLYIKVLY